MRVCAFVSLVLLAACTPERTTTTMTAPGRITQALSSLSDLEATAHLTPRGGAPGEGVALKRGDDGVTFSGFVDATPGDYALHVVFTGIPQGGTARVFLGRWISNAFTVSAGASATPEFTRPLDTIGLPQDGGDEDGDGLGLLDELLWGADPTSSDSDDDGVLDGQDCTPNAASDTFVIVASGSHEDCDADGAIRADLPYGTPGGDCDDRDPATFPGAVDVCTDTIDRDCNPATCPSEDAEGPEITNLTPADGATLGCHATIAADVADASQVSNVQVVLKDATLSGDARLFATKRGDRWTAPPLNQAAALEGLDAGPTDVEITAVDGELNETTSTARYTLSFDVPTIDSFAPAQLTDAVRTVTIGASAANGIASIVLYAAPRNAQGTYSVGGAVELGRKTQSPATFEVDLTTLPDGRYVLYATVEDTLANRLQPNVVVSPSPGASGLRILADYRCLPTPTGYDIPARLFTIGGVDTHVPTRVRDRLDEAIAVAAQADPNAALVSIFTLGVDDAGRVRLDRADSFSVRLQYMFYNAGTDTAMTVSWYSAVWTTDNPVVDLDAGNVVAETPIADPAALVDSDIPVAASAADGCNALTGDDDDSLQYSNDGTRDVVYVFPAGGGVWAGTATDPPTEITGCN